MALDLIDETSAIFPHYQMVGQRGAGYDALPLAPKFTATRKVKSGLDKYHYTIDASSKSHREFSSLQHME